MNSFCDLISKSCLSTHPRESQWVGDGWGPRVKSARCPLINRKSMTTSILHHYFTLTATSTTPPKPLELGSDIMTSSDHISSWFGPILYSIYYSNNNPMDFFFFYHLPFAAHSSYCSTGCRRRQHFCLNDFWWCCFSFALDFEKCFHVFTEILETVAVKPAKCFDTLYTILHITSLDLLCTFLCCLPACIINECT